MKSELRAYWDGLLHLLYPQLCPACGDTLPVGVALLCLTCQQTLPETGFHEQAENTFTERFAGRVALAHGTALYYFSKGTRVQRLIHQLKYKQKREIGYQLGRYYGLQLRGDPNYQSLTGIVPVPLHPRKLHQRGYNQAELFAEGLATAMDLPYWPTALIRHTYSSSQTTKSRYERMANVLKAFARSPGFSPPDAHLLLVDDVMTTGATLEACALRLLEIPQARLSMATIAIAGE